jgi:hypothetical protein
MVKPEKRNMPWEKEEEGLSSSSAVLLSLSKGQRYAIPATGVFFLTIISVQVF